jgi:hypothetical protein
MKKYIWFLFVVPLCSLSVAAECGPGYQSAKIVKVLRASPGASTPARADEGSPRDAQNARLVIFGAGGKQYGMRLPSGSGSQEVSVAVGDEVCFRKEGTVIRARTGDGKRLPGVAHPMREMPQTQ